MRTALLFLLLFLSTSSFAQEILYNQKNVIGSTPVFDLGGMTIDNEDYVYLLDKLRVLKMKEGKVVSEFSVEKSEYTDSYSNAPSGIAVDNNQNIYLINFSKRRIEKHDRSGKLLKVFGAYGTGEDEFNFLSSITFDKDQNLNIVDESKRKIFVYSPEGDFKKTISLADLYPAYNTVGIALAIDDQNNFIILESKRHPNTGSRVTLMTIQNRYGEIIHRFSDEVLKESGLYSPSHVALDKTGNIYVSDSYNFGKGLVVFSKAGEFIKNISTNIEPHFHYWNSKYKISFDSQNSLYLGSYLEFGSMIRKYDTNNNLIEQWGSLRRPHDVVLDKWNNILTIDHYNNLIVKADQNGNEIFVFGGKEAGLLNPQTLAVDDNENIYVADIVKERVWIKKFDKSGNLLTTFTRIDGYYKSATGRYPSIGLALDNTGNIYVTSFETNALAKYNNKGEFITYFGSKGKGEGQLWRPLDVSVDAGGYVYVVDISGTRIQKFTSTGKYIRQYGNFSLNNFEESSHASISSDAFGNVLVSSNYLGKPEIRLFDLRGKVISSLPTLLSWSENRVAAISKDGRFIASTGYYKDVMRIYETNTTREYNLIQGNIYHDLNANCIKDVNETGLPEELMKVEPGPYFGATDESGGYSIVVEKGTYNVELLFNSSKIKELASTCYSGEISEGVKFDTFGNYAINNDIGAVLTLKPNLTVSVSSNRRRRCFESVTKVNYRNTGFAPAMDAKVYLQLPEQVELLSADKPFVRQPNGTYVFDVGTVEAGKSGVITIQDKVICGDESIRGMSVCTKVWMTPANATTPPADSKWDGSMILTKGKCLPTGYVRLSVHNTGKKDMAAYSKLRVFSNSELIYQQQYKLAAGDSLILHAPGEGKTIRLEAEQAPENPVKTMASVTVQGCQKEGGVVAFGADYVNMFAADEEEPEVASDCQQIIDSYDPNDKLITPTGRTEENYTPTNTALKYKIRFQNTGTDVAYRVVVVDTLSEHLDISTLQMGAVSHNYRMNVSGKGLPVLTWTFDNIMLPDSNANEPASHGYIQFSIQPNTDLPEKTAVENFADIFFDFNSPVRTNTTINRIYDMPPVIDETQRLDPEEVIVQPVITALTPDNGRVGAEITVAGDDFSTDPAENKVTINGVAATVTAASAKQLTVLVPEGATTGKVALLTPDGAATSAEDFTVWQRPVFSSFSPAEGIIGSSVTLTGSFFYSEHEQFSVKLGDMICKIRSRTENSITLEIPAGATSGVFSLVTPGGEAAATQPYRIWHAPRISGFSADTVKVGDVLVLHGENFSEQKERNTLQLSNLPIAVQQASSSMLQLTIPMEAVSGPVKLKTPGGDTYSEEELTVIPFPKITTVAPASGSVGTLITLTGQNFSAFQTQDIVNFNGTLATVLEANSTSIKVRVPRGAVTGKVIVTGIGGQADADFSVILLTPEQAIQVYPNPTKGKFEIDFQHADFEVQTAQVFDATGRLVKDVKISSGQSVRTEIDLSDKLPGVYMVVIQTEHGRVLKRVSLL